MVGEIIDDGDPVHNRAHLEPALHAAEGGQGFDDRSRFDSLPRGQRRSRGGVQRVVLPGHGQGYLQPLLPGAKNLPTRVAVVVGQFLNAPGRAGFESVALDGTKGARNAFIYVGAAVEGHHPAAARNQVDQPAEGGLDRS